MDVWLRLSSQIPASQRSLRLVVTPVLRSCSTSDIWWTPCSQAGSGPCVRRDLLCDGIINCGASEEGGERCRTRVKAGDSGPGTWFLPSLVTLVSSGIFITGLMLFCCTLINRDKIRNSFQENSGQTGGHTRSLSTPVGATCYVAASAPVMDRDLEDRPPSYAEAILLPRP